MSDEHTREKSAASPLRSLASDPDLVRSLFGAADTGVVVTDADDTVTWAGDRVGEYFGFDAEEAVGTERTAVLESWIRPRLEAPARFPASNDGCGPDGTCYHVLATETCEERWVRHHGHEVSTGPLAGGRIDQFVDVTERHVSDRPVDDQRYETLFDHFPNGAVTLVDESLRYRLARGELFDGLPETPRSVEGAKVSDVTSGDRTEFVETYRRTLAGESVTTETTVADRVLVHRTHPVSTEDGSVCAAIGVTQDITDRKARERELRRNREFLRDVQAVADVGGWEVDFRSETLTWTDEVYRIHDLPTDYEPSVDSGLAFYHPEDRGRMERAYEALARDGERYDLELRIVTASDEVRWVRSIGKPWTDEEGRLVGARGTIQDITDRKTRERKLEESRNRYRTLVENVPNGAVALVDADLRYTTVGGTPIEEASTTPSELVGRSVETALPSDLATLLVPNYAAALDGEHRTFTGSIGDRDYRFRIVPVRSDDGRVFAAMGMSQDITTEERRERELREAKQRLHIALEETETGVWVLEDGDTLRPFGTITDLFGVDPGTDSLETYMERIHPADRPAVEDGLRAAREDGARFDVEYRVRTGRGDRWVHARGKVLDDTDGQRMVGVTTDVTDRKRRVGALEKRERVLRELHTATREFYPPSSLPEIATFLVEFVERAFGFGYVSVKRFDEETGRLQPAARSSSVDAPIAPGPVDPGENPIWEAYRNGESRIFDGGEIGDGTHAALNQALIVPIGDFGVTLACTTGERAFDDVDLDLIEVAAANAESAFQRHHSDRVRTEITRELSTQQTKVDELRGVIDVIQGIQRRIADSESQAALDAGVCEELRRTEPIDFVWIGRPRGRDTDLEPVAWAGDDGGYLDSVGTDESDGRVPAQRAAASHETYTLSNVSEHVLDDAWAKEALSAGLRSVVCIPLVYDEVLYGVLTAYSATEDAFGQLYEDLLTDVTSLVVNYSRILEHRYEATNREFLELEFALSDATYPLQRLATEADAAIRYDTVAESTSDAVRCLVTVERGDAERVLERARSTASVVDAEWFGTVEHGQLSLWIKRPFLPSDVVKHGGRLLESTTTADGTTVRVALPATASPRPLLDSITSRYPDIDLLAQRQTTSPEGTDTATVTDRLTDRQHEILNAAYYGGYYETPRKVTGEDLAESFEISSPAVYNHLQAAHRTLLETVLDPEHGFRY
ncbi:PAS domain-containing protein [Halorientalis pallida]|uniref:histidine kinase n=1 Tax=Halorientalis pallida TaxID=2479928 RepID=A0A498KYD3_9EURY|nr:PAS domain-containing protein [Halorientalis pallida]RXK46878.1 PAS domain S-box protein [Halorientalis pallida]